MVRVIVERRCKPGNEEELEKLLIELRVRAINQRGYVSGETLSSVEDPSHWLVISTWIDTDHWKVWETSLERKEVVKKIQPLLAAPERAAIFTFIRKGGAASAHVLDK